ncbi:MAG: MFS transporter [Burkholderiales bacterium]
MAPTTFPVWPLVATLATQTLAIMAAYTLPALAPMVAADLKVDGAWVGYFVSVVYGVGIGSSLLAAGFIHRHGAVRACQLVLLAPLLAGLRAPFALLAGNPALAHLTFTSFIYSGTQPCFVAFMAVHLTSRAGFDLIAAGQALAAYQISGVVTRPVWGWLADRVMPARQLLVLQGVLMAAAAAMAGQFSAGWPTWLILLICVAAGATASGYTGIAYGEFARQLEART